jgi:hypothetical protein
VLHGRGTARAVRLRRGYLALACAGCASLSPAGAHVERVQDHAALKACAYLGDVSVRPSPLSENDDIIRLRNLAVELGADAIWIDSTTVAPGGRLYAAAFACHPRPTNCPEGPPCPR